MSEKIETAEALILLAQEHKRHVEEIRRLEEIADIVICDLNRKEIHIYDGLLDAGLPLECETFSFTDAKKYSILVDGVRFFELEDTPKLLPYNTGI